MSAYIALILTEQLLNGVWNLFIAIIASDITNRTPAKAHIIRKIFVELYKEKIQSGIKLKSVMKAVGMCVFGKKRNLTYK